MFKIISRVVFMNSKFLSIVASSVVFATSSLSSCFGHNDIAIDFYRDSSKEAEYRSLLGISIDPVYYVGIDLGEIYDIELTKELYLTESFKRAQELIASGKVDVNAIDKESRHNIINHHIWEGVMYLGKAGTFSKETGEKDIYGCKIYDEFPVEETFSAFDEHFNIIKLILENGGKINYDVEYTLTPLPRQMNGGGFEISYNNVKVHPSGRFMHTMSFDAIYECVMSFVEMFDIFRSNDQLEDSEERTDENLVQRRRERARRLIDLFVNHVKENSQGYNPRFLDDRDDPNDYYRSHLSHIVELMSRDQYKFLLNMLPEELRNEILAATH